VANCAFKVLTQRSSLFAIPLLAFRARPDQIKDVLLLLILQIAQIEARCVLRAPVSLPVVEFVPGRQPPEARIAPRCTAFVTQARPPIVVIIVANDRPLLTIDEAIGLGGGHDEERLGDR